MAKNIFVYLWFRVTQSLHSLKQLYKNFVFILLFFLIFILINWGYYCYLFLSFNIFSVFYIWLLEFIAFGIAYEMTEITLLLTVKEGALSFLNKLGYYPPVALLYVTCDDIEPKILATLNNQNYPNLDIFILDDSQMQISHKLLNESEFKIIRRSSRKGYKAGNLNNWLKKYGWKYSYFVVLDADSILPSTFVEEMIKYAEYPENKTVAIIESLICPWNVKKEFVRLQSVMLPLLHQTNLNLYNKLDLKLSSGHNNLYRTEAIISYGGFNENYLAEDQAMSIDLLRNKKWQIKTVPIVSYERLPENLNEYAKREARWAFQTFQLLNLGTSGLTWNLRFKILRMLYHYTFPIVMLFGIFLLIIVNIYYWRLFSHSFLISTETAILFLKSKFVLFWLIYINVPLFLRAIMALYKKVKLIDFVKHFLLYSALFFATQWCIIRRVSSHWTTDYIGFNVTGKMPSPSLLDIIKIGWPVFIAVWLALFSILLNPIFSGLNLIWALPASLSPLLIFYYQQVEK